MRDATNKQTVTLMEYAFQMLARGIFTFTAHEHDHDNKISWQPLNVMI